MLLNKYEAEELINETVSCIWLDLQVSDICDQQGL
jgi:hypothetical protein